MHNVSNKKNDKAAQYLGELNLTKPNNPEQT